MVIVLIEHSNKSIDLLKVIKMVLIHDIVEIDAGETDEAKFAKAMDRLEPLLQNTSNEGGTWTEFDISYEKKVHQKKSVIKEGSAQIWDFAEQLIDESVEKGILKK